MNLTPTCPDIPDSWRGNASQACRVLGGDRPISRSTLAKWVKMSPREGGIKTFVGKDGKRYFSGRELKRFWNAR